MYGNVKKWDIKEFGENGKLFNSFQSQSTNASIHNSAKSEKFQNWFNQTENVENNCSITTRRNKNKTVPLFRPIPTRTSRYKRSPLPYLTEMFNEMNTMPNQRNMNQCTDVKNVNCGLQITKPFAGPVVQSTDYCWQVCFVGSPLLNKLIIIF